MNFTRKLSLSLVLSCLSGLNGNLFCSAADADLTIMAKPENCAHTVPPIAPVTPKATDSLKRAPSTKVSASIPAEFHIGLSPEGKKNAETKERIELYRSQLANNEGALQAWAKLTPEQKTKTLSEVAMNKENTPARCKSIRELGLLSQAYDVDSNGLMSLARVAVLDSDGGIRALARKALTARGEPKILTPLASVLESDDPIARHNAAAALKEFGGPKVFEVIIEHWKDTWGPGARSHVFFGIQKSYVADYDISGDSYDPVIKTFMTGTVLDVKPLRVECDAYYTTIREVAPDGVKLPNDPVAWQKWLGKEKDKLIEDGRQKRVAAISMLSDDRVE